MPDGGEKQTKEGDFVIVAVPTAKGINHKYFIAKIVTCLVGNEYDVTFLRNKKGNDHKFVYPNVQDDALITGEGTEIQGCRIGRLHTMLEVQVWYRYPTLP